MTRSKRLIKDMFDACNKHNFESVPIIKSELEQVLKDLEEKELYDRIKLMLKQKECVLRYIESEDCFAVRCILDDKWYKLTDDLIKNNIKEEVKPTPLINKVKELKEKVEKQDKILEILEPYTELEYDNVNDEYNLIIDASERIPLSEDYEINRVILSIDDYEAMPIKEWLGNDK